MRSPQLPAGGPERYTTRRVVFVRPFTLGKAPEVYPAGTYQVETKDEAIEHAGHTAHVRTGTVLIIPTAAGTVARQIKGSELDEAISRDAEDAGETAPNENPDRGEADT